MKKTVDVSLPIGPVHPCLKEPVRIKCETMGERVLRAEIEMGYVKKGIERIMVGRPWQEVMFLAERICGICSVIHNMVFIETLERIGGVTVPPRAEYLRVIVNELDRIQSHLLANYSYCYTIEHETLAMYLLNLRETAMDMLELITGARVTCAFIIPGGVRFDLSAEDEGKLRLALDKIEKDLKRFEKMFDTGSLIALRSRDVGVISKEDIIASGAVGPTARASGVDFDSRQNHPVYQRLGFKPVVLNGCDNYTRISARFKEVFQSIGLIRDSLEKMNALSDKTIRISCEIGAGEYTWTGEAPRGGLTYAVETDEFGHVKKIGIQTPSIMNMDACAHHMMKGADSAADVTAVFISSDPCISCNER